MDEYLIDKTHSKLREKSWRGPLAILGGFLINLNGSMLNSWGIIGVYITSYFHSFDKSYNSSTMFPCLPLGYLFEAICCFIVAQLLQRLGKNRGRKFSIAMGVIVLSTCTFLSSLVTSPYLFMLCFAIGVGFASGTSCLLPAWAGWSYYPERKGLVTGINLAGFSLGGLVYGLIFLFIANPSNIPPSIIVDRGAEKEILFDQEVYNQVQFALQICAAVALCNGMIGFLLISERKHAGEQEAKEDNDWYKHLSNSQFWMLFAGFFLNFYLWGFMANEYKVFGFTQIKNDQLLSIVGPVGCFFATIGRVLWGQLLDIFPFKKLIITNFSIALALSIFIYWTPASEWLYSIFVITVFFNGSGSFVVYGTQSGRSYPNCPASIWSVLIIAMTTSELSTILLDKLVLQNFGYFYTFQTIALLQVLGIIVTFKTRLPEKEEKLFD